MTKACEKHYALEQELAFYKIDHKFDALSRPPVIHTPDSSVVCWQLRAVNKCTLLSTEYARDVCEKCSVLYFVPVICSII